MKITTTDLEQKLMNANTGGLNISSPKCRNRRGKQR